jgi:ElaB/YqjD/DUF883 family membrane-anchored ribosome-binding protein
MGKGAHQVTERTTAGTSSAWDADGLPTDPASRASAESTDLSGDPEVDALVAEIEVTRSEMTGTVEELGDRLDPAAIADRTTEKVREATIGKVESKVDDMTNAASELVSNAGDTVQQTGSGVVETIRRNPVPAALAGFGIGWLILNRQPGRRTDSVWAPTRSSSGWAPGDPTAGTFGESYGARGKDPREAIEDVTTQARRTAEEVASTVGETANEAATTVRSTATSVASQAQRTIESNPLAVGAIALAVGTAVGLALPASQTEKRVMGQAGSQLIEKAETAARKPLEELESSTGQGTSGQGTSGQGTSDQSMSGR